MLLSKKFYIATLFFTLCKISENLFILNNICKWETVSTYLFFESAFIVSIANRSIYIYIISYDCNGLKIKSLDIMFIPPKVTLMQSEYPCSTALQCTHAFRLVPHATIAQIAIIPLCEIMQNRIWFLLNGSKTRQSSARASLRSCQSYRKFDVPGTLNPLESAS